RSYEPRAPCNKSSRSNIGRVIAAGERVRRPNSQERLRSRKGTSMNSTLTMTVERWERLRSLYDEVQTLAPERRVEFVVNTCDDDTLLRGQSALRRRAAGGIDDRSLYDRAHA